MSIVKIKANERKLREPIRKNCIQWISRRMCHSKMLQRKGWEEWYQIEMWTGEHLHKLQQAIRPNRRLQVRDRMSNEVSRALRQIREGQLMISWCHPEETEQYGANHDTIRRGMEPELTNTNENDTLINSKANGMQEFLIICAEYCCLLWTLEIFGSLSYLESKGFIRERSLRSFEMTKERFRFTRSTTTPTYWIRNLVVWLLIR